MSGGHVSWGRPHGDKPIVCGVLSACRELGGLQGWMQVNWGGRLRCKRCFGRLASSIFDCSRSIGGETKRWNGGSSSGLGGWVIVG